MSGVEGKVGVGIYPLAASKLGELNNPVFYLFLYVSSFVRHTPTIHDPHLIVEQVHTHSLQGLQHAL
jgi:hypothetical protein